MILYRPVGLQELEMIYDGGMKAFPARLPQQPIFYPVLDLEYARQTASDWNTESGQLAGYVTQFKVEDEYISRFEEHAVGGSQYREFWIPAEEMDEFNRQIVGHIRVLEAHFGDAFEGFVPEQFGMQGKSAVDQFTLLANSYVYKRMEFFLEIKRNHKAVFLNYPFWQKYDFRNPGLKQKTLQAIKEAWLTSFPKIPLPLPPPEHEDTPLVEQNDSSTLVDPVQEDITPVAHSDSFSFVNPVPEEVPPIRQTESHSLGKPVREESAFVRRTDLHSLMDSLQKDTRRETQADPHFVRGVKLGTSGNSREAVEELSRAVEEEPGQVSAHTSLGVAFHRLGEDDRALASYENALKIDPKHAEAHYFRANILYSRGEAREAITEYTVAIGLEPGLIEAHQKPAPQDRLTDYNELPAEIYRIARPAHRILALNKLLESNPRQAQVFKERAAEYSRLWNDEQAIADYSSTLAIQPDDANAHHFRGLAYQQIGQSDRALEDFQQAIAIDPQLSDVYIQRGVTLGKMGNFRQSISSLTEGIRLAPRNPDIYFNRGTSYFQLGDFESAIADFSMVIQLSSNDEDAYYWRGICNEEAGRQHEAIADYRQFLAISQNPGAREEIEQRLRQWNAGTRESASGRGVIPGDRPKNDQFRSENPDQDPDLYDLITALGDRALDSIWLGSGVDCRGEGAEELLSLTGQNLPVEGHDFLRITSGIRQTMQGDFQAFDPDAASPWIFIRAREGSGFYVETNDPKSRERLKARFQSAEEVEGAQPSYEGLYIHV